VRMHNSDVEKLYDKVQVGYTGNHHLFLQKLCWSYERIRI